MVDAIRQVLYQKSEVHSINSAASDAIDLGYLDKNKSQLVVQTTLTQADNSAYFSFNFRSGDQIQLSTNINKGIRVQIYQASNNRLIADNYGNSTTKEAYADFTDKTGKSLKNGQYIVKLSYADSASKSSDLSGALTFSSGTTFVSRYKTLSAPETMQSYLSRGGDFSSSGGSQLTIASFVDGNSNGLTNIFDFWA